MYPRPTVFDSDVITLVAEQLVASVLAWRGVPYGWEDQVRVRDTLVQVLELETDGYALAKSLDDGAGWENVDAGLVQILDRAVLYRTEVCRLKVQQWVVDMLIKPTLKVSDQVILKGDPGVPCTILEVVPELAIYRIQTTTALLEHKGRSQLVPFEDVDAINSITVQ